jgi:sugar/nucleoside kinase (ribokinase family)
MARGLFVGLITLDCIYQVSQVPARDEKIVAQESLLVAGGPATNAAVAFRHLGNEAVLLGALGQHPVTSLIRADLEGQGLEIRDLSPDYPDPPPLSTILVTAATGERAVISRNAVGRQLRPDHRLTDLLRGIDMVLIDGHQMAVGEAVATLARQQGIPVVIDAGSWKPGFDRVLPQATSVIAAKKFRWPGQTTAEGSRQSLVQRDIPEVATTDGGHPIQFCQGHHRGSIPVPTVAVVDTLGAGDIFHGAFCHYRLEQPFDIALAQAASIAALSCQYFGTRAWLTRANSVPTPGLAGTDPLS